MIAVNNISASAAKPAIAVYTLSKVAIPNNVVKELEALIKFTLEDML